MAGKISELTALSTPATTDLLEILDVSDTTMAATGTNKKIAVADLGVGGGGGAFYGGKRIPFDEGVWGGLPGRRMVWGGNHTGTPGWGIAVPFLVSSGEVAHATKWRAYVLTAQAGSKLDAAVYSVPSFLDNTTGTKVAGSEVVAIDCSTTGTKLVSLPETLTLNPGRYYCAWLQYGSSPSAELYAHYCDGGPGNGFTMSDISRGNASGGPDGMIFIVGASSLAASYDFTINYAGGWNGTCPMNLVP